jgi:hypothetical protein
MIQSLGMKNVLVLAAVLTWLGGTALMSQPKTPGAPVLESYIPVTAGPWLSEADRIFDASTIFDYIDGAGEVYRSYNMKRLVARRFHKDGKPDIVVDAFDMGSSADAFGAFTHDLDGEDAGTGQGSRYNSGLLSFWKDRYFLSVYAEEETAETRALVLELGRAIAAAIPGEGPKPALLRLLPPEGLEAGRVRFFHNHSVLNYHYFVAAGDVLLLGQTADAVLADYGRADGGRSRLLVVSYADDGTAVRAGRSFAQACMRDSRDGTVSRAANGRWTALLVRGRYAAVVFDADTENEARARLKAVGALMAAPGQGGKE